VRAIADQFEFIANNAALTTTTIIMLKSIGESCCEIDKTKRLFDGLLEAYFSRGDFRKVKEYLIKGWR
jgi:hypothetical protein